MTAANVHFSPLFGFLGGYAFFFKKGLTELSIFFSAARKGTFCGKNNMVFRRLVKRPILWRRGFLSQISAREREKYISNLLHSAKGGGVLHGGVSDKNLTSNQKCLGLKQRDAAHLLILFYWSCSKLHFRGKWHVLRCIHYTTSIQNFIATIKLARGREAGFGFTSCCLWKVQFFDGHKN